jgi:hypothetical protein
LPRRRHQVVPLPLEQSVELHSSAWMSPASSSLARPPPPPFSIGGPCHKATPRFPVYLFLLLCAAFSVHSHGQPRGISTPWDLVAARGTKVFWQNCNAGLTESTTL